MVTERSSNAFDTIRIRGKWWIPGSADEPRKVSGELTFDVRAGGVLDLDEALSNGIGNITVIHGEGSEGERVTVFNGVSTRIKTSNKSSGVFKKETVLFYNMWIGDQWFNSKDDVRFAEYSFSMHDIENWADRKHFSTPRRLTANHASVHYSALKPILLFQDEHLQILLVSSWSGPSSSMGQLEGSIQHYPRIVIRSKSDLLPYYGNEDSLSEREWMIFVLIALLMGRVTWKFGFEGVIQPEKIEEGRYVPGISVRHYFQHDWGEVDPSQHSYRYDLLFPYEMLCRTFPRIAARFSTVLRINDDPIAVLYRMQCKKHAFIPSTLPELLFAFEKLEGNLCEKANKRLTKAGKPFSKQLLNKLKLCCSKKVWRKLEPKLRPKDTSFSDRCHVAFKKMSKVYPELESNLQKPLIKYLLRTRNLYAHEVKSSIDDPALYIYTAHWLAEFMTLMILRACGVSAKKVREVFFREWGPDHGKTKRFFTYIQKEVAAGRLK